MVQDMTQQVQNKTVNLQSHIRDLLGFIRMENTVLMDQGQLTLRGLYLQKMIMLRDLEERAESLSQEKSDSDVAHCLILLRQVQRELKVNTAHHLDALKTRSVSYSDHKIEQFNDLYESNKEGMA